MSARKLTLAARARADLEDILLYTELEWGERQANTYQRIIQDTFDTLLQFPYLGRKRDDLAPGLLDLSRGRTHRLLPRHG